MGLEHSCSVKPDLQPVEHEMMDGSGNNSDWSEAFAAMDLEALKEMRRSVDRAISSYETRKRKQALSALDQVAKEHGFRLSDLVTDQKSGRPGKSAEGGLETAYANPENPDETWSGRGRRPRWVHDALAAGRSLDDLKA